MRKLAAVALSSPHIANGMSCLALHLKALFVEIIAAG
jgi:hypothetical protein